MRLGTPFSMTEGVLGDTGGQWLGWTADVQSPQQPNTPPLEVPPQDQWAGGPNRVSWTPPYTNPPGFTAPGRHAGYDSNILPRGLPPDRSINTTGRVRREPLWPAGGVVSRPIVDRHYDVQLFTGYSSSTVRAGQWSRGSVARYSAPTWHPAKPPIMYDPTDPDTWDEVRTFN